MLVALNSFFIISFVSSQPFLSTKNAMPEIKTISPSASDRSMQDCSCGL
jgi:hypothetical protein